MLSDPTVWGLIILAVVVFFSSSAIVKEIHAANLDRRDDHKEMMGVLNILPDELDQIKVQLDCIDINTGGKDRGVPLENVLRDGSHGV